jgi:hypothetical protein
MSINDAALEQAGVDIFYHLGDDATFYPTAGDPVPCKVNVEKEGTNEPDGFAMQARGEQITLEAQRSVLGKIPVARTPNRAGEKFVMDADGLVYEVYGILDSDEFFVTSSVKVCE